MRIGFINPTILLRRPIVELAHQVRQRGHQATILSPISGRPSPVPAHFESNRVATIGLPSHEIPALLWSIPTWSSIRTIWQAVREYDVLHLWAPYYFVAILPIIFSRLRPGSAKIVITFDTIPGFSFRFASIIDPLMWLYHWLIGSWLFRLADRRTLYSAELLPYASRAGLGRNFLILSSGIQLAEQLPPHPRSERLELLFIGLLNRRKGVGILIEAVSQSIKDGLNIHLRLAGDGPDRQAFEHQVRALDLAGSIEFLGRQKDVRSLFAGADLFVLPSYGEGLPGVVMEAMMYGVPVVATDIPCLRELIPNQAHGLLVAPGNVAALVAALKTTVANRRDTVAITRPARERIINFSWDIIAPKYIALYEQLA